VHAETAVELPPPLAQVQAPERGPVPVLAQQLAPVPRPLLVPGSRPAPLQGREPE
jgi:hypothetical protein